MDDVVDNSQSTVPFFLQGAGQQQTNSITSDRGLLNQNLNVLATDLSSQSTDTTAALGAILAAIQAKPSA